MKCIYFFGIFLTLQSTFVNSRTIDNVLEDFQPVFDEIHNAIYSLQMIIRGVGSSQAGDIRGAVSQYSWETQKSLENAMYDIRDSVYQIIGENGMIGHEDLTKHCFDSKDETLSDLIRDKTAGSNVCSQLGNKALENLNKILNDYYTEQSSWHTNVDYAKQRCADKTTPFDMQTCLIQHLYFLEKPFVEDMRRKMDEFTEDNNKYVKRVVGDIKICFSVVSEKTLNDRFPIIADFKKCVIEAAQNKP